MSGHLWEHRRVPPTSTSPLGVTHAMSAPLLHPSHAVLSLEGEQGNYVAEK